MPVIESEFDGSIAHAGRVFSMSLVSFTLAVLIIPRVSEAAKSLFATAMIGIAGAVFLLLASFSTQYWLFLCFFSAGFGFVSGALYINVLSMAAASDRSRWLTPVMVAVFGLGGVVFGPLWRQLAANDWGTFALLPLAGLLFISSVATLFVDKRSMCNIYDSASASRPSNKPSYERHANACQSNDSFRLLLIWGIFATGSTAGLMVLGLASKIVEHAGGSISMASTAIAAIAFGNTIGRLSVGAQLLVLNPASVALVSTVVVAGGLVLVLYSSAAAMIATGLSLIALGYGIMASAMPVMVQRQFGPANFSKYFSIVFTAWGAAGLTSPWLAGIMFDASGSFVSALQLALLVTVLCSLLLIVFTVTGRAEG